MEAHPHGPNNHGTWLMVPRFDLHSLSIHIFLQRRQIIMSENLSQLEDADITKLVTELQTMLVNRDAATQAFAKIGQQSLFDFLR